MLKSNFPVPEVKPDDPQPLDQKAEFERKAKESIGGSMVFTEHKLKYWDGKEDGDGEVS